MKEVNNLAKILLIWELGGGWGHLSRFRPIASELSRRGHEIFFVLKDLSRVESTLGEFRFPVLQSPLWVPKMRGFQSPPLNYAEILYRAGFLYKEGLSGMVRGWRSLFNLIKPDLLIIDYGPTALLASRGTAIPSTMIGSGFSSPPRVSPTPNMRPWITIPEERLLQSDQNVLKVVNQVLKDLGERPLQKLSELFDVEEDFLCTFPELDHYQNRGEARYWGPIFELMGGSEPQWPPGEEKKIFAYLKHEYRDFEKIVRSLWTLPYSILIHTYGVSEIFIKKYEKPNIKFISHLVNLSTVREEADLIICHAGNGTTCATLLGGKPLLLLPMQLEQFLFAMNVVNYGAGLLVNPESRNHDYTDLIKQLLRNPSFSERARSFALKYKDFNQKAQLESIANRSEEIIKKGLRGSEWVKTS